MKKIIVALFFALLISCQKSEVPFKPCYLESVQSTTGSAIYSYNEKNQLTSYAAPGIITSVITYDAEGKVATEVDNDIFYITYNYDTKNRLTLWDQTVDGYAQYNFQSKFFYNAANQDTLIEYYKYDLSTNNYYLWRFTRLSYSSASNKNYSKRKTYDAVGDSLLYTEDYLWDTHPNPYLSNPFFVNEPPPSNNIKGYTYTLAGAEPQSTIYDYTYTSNGFPLYQTIPGYVPIITTYTYTNCK